MPPHKGAFSFILTLMTDLSDVEESGAQDDIGDYPQEELDETSAEFVDQLVMKLIVFTEEFCNVTLFP